LKMTLNTIHQTRRVTLDLFIYFICLTGVYYFLSIFHLSFFHWPLCCLSSDSKFEEKQIFILILEILKALEKLVVFALAAGWTCRTSILIICNFPFFYPMLVNMYKWNNSFPCFMQILSQRWIWGLTVY
jgi:hypothetical protein